MITVLPILKEVVVLSEDGALRLRGGGPSADFLLVCIVRGMISLTIDYSVQYTPALLSSRYNELCSYHQSPLK